MSSTNIYFKPTFLYIKQHSITGLLYFGKTIKDPEKYKGSGKYWTNHIKKHGKEHVVNLWYCLFLDKETLTDFAINFSVKHNIVEATNEKGKKIWANEIVETGVSSPLLGIKNGMHRNNWDQNSNKEKMRREKQRTKQKSKTKEQNIKSYSRVKSDDEKQLISEKVKNSQLLTCPHCGFSCQGGNAKKHHFDNCKSNPNLDIDAYKQRKMIGRVTRIFDRKEMDAGNWAIWIRKQNYPL